jgi:hypothetical protein
MIKYNWTRLNNYFDWNPKEVLKYFYYLTATPVPSHIGKINAKDREKIKELLDYNDRYSFLLDARSLLHNESYYKYIYDYIRLASLRSLFDYNVRGIDYVELWRIPKTFDLSKNPLLIVDDGKVCFLYDSKKQEK